MDSNIICFWCREYIDLEHPEAHQDCDTVGQTLTGRLLENMEAPEPVYYIPARDISAKDMPESILFDFEEIEARVLALYLADPENREYMLEQGADDGGRRIFDKMVRELKASKKKEPETP